MASRAPRGDRAGTRRDKGRSARCADSSSRLARELARDPFSYMDRNGRPDQTTVAVDVYCNRRPKLMLRTSIDELNAGAFDITIRLQRYDADIFSASVRLI